MRSGASPGHTGTAYTHGAPLVRRHSPEVKPDAAWRITAQRRMGGRGSQLSSSCLSFWNPNTLKILGSALRAVPGIPWEDQSRIEPNLQSDPCSHRISGSFFCELLG